MTPLTMEGFCGHPCPDGKHCNNAGDCPSHPRREKSLMGLEDERSAILQRGVCGVPLGAGGTCRKPQGRCGHHTEKWHLQRELRAMQVEDDISCIAGRGRCGVVPRSGNKSCEKPTGRCPIHAEENDRCQSALDHKPEERCWNPRRDGSRFCEKHAD